MYTPEHFYSLNPPVNSYFWVRMAAGCRWTGLAAEDRWVIAEYLGDRLWHIPGIGGRVMPTDPDVRVEEIDTFCGSNPHYQANIPVEHGLAALERAPDIFMTALQEGDGEEYSPIQLALIRHEFQLFCDHLHDVLNGEYAEFVSDAVDNTVTLELPL
jgi:hypothetical protein